eukprot:6071372-Amphidinium_carterae.1
MICTSVWTTCRLIGWKHTIHHQKRIDRITYRKTPRFHPSLHPHLNFHSTKGVVTIGDSQVRRPTLYSTFPEHLEAVKARLGNGEGGCIDTFEFRPVLDAPGGAGTSRQLSLSLGTTVGQINPTTIGYQGNLGCSVCGALPTPLLKTSRSLHKYLDHKGQLTFNPSSPITNRKFCTQTLKSSKKKFGALGVVAFAV